MVSQTSGIGGGLEKSCGPGSPTLESSLWGYPQATVANKPGHRGEHEVTVKTIACGDVG
jgi:hypothetical protein